MSNKDVILLTGKGQLLESLEILGQYDGGTVSETKNNDRNR